MTNLEKRCNNAIIDPKGKLSNGQLYFVQRWWELLDHSTHDIHNVKCLNLHGVLIELLKVCQEVRERDTFKWHLRSLVDEARELLHDDPVIQQFAPSYFNILRRCLQNTPQQEKEIYKLSLQLSYTLNYIKERYIKWVITQIHKEMNGTDYKKIDSLLNCLISELLYRGWSISTLFTLVDKNEFYKPKYMRTLLSTFLKKKQPYLCIIRIRSNIDEDYVEACMQVGLNIVSGKEIIESHSNKQLKTKISEDALYYIEEVDAFDWNSAISKYMEHFLPKEDMLKFYGFKSPDVATNSIILSKNSNEFRSGIDLPRFKSVLSPVSLEKPLTYAAKLTTDTMNILQRVYQYSRQAEESSSAESCFLNIWVSLEAFTKSDDYGDRESDFTRISDNVSAVVSMSYVFSLIRYFLADCKRCEVNMTSFTNGTGLPMNTAKLLTILLDTDQSLALKEECDSKNLLLGLRCENISNLLRAPNNISIKIRKHCERVKWQLQRIYRVRNSIVHSANHDNHNILLLIKHLNSYLRSTVNVTAFYLYKTNGKSFDEVFVVMKQNLEATIDLLGDVNVLVNKKWYQKLLIEGALFI